MHRGSFLTHILVPHSDGSDSEGASRPRTAGTPKEQAGLSEADSAGSDSEADSDGSSASVKRKKKGRRRGKIADDEL